MFGAGSSGDSSEGEPNSSARGEGSDSGDSFHSRSSGRAGGLRAPPPAAAAAAPAGGAALDEEEGGGRQPAWWRRWAARAGCGRCVGGGGHAGAAAGKGLDGTQRPGWLRLQGYKLQLMQVGGCCGCVGCLIGRARLQSARRPTLAGLLWDAGGAPAARATQPPWPPPAPWPP